ncbi:MAG: hypothetical protein R3E97_09155 [Candidatus Eisenbacteria bacterium]
MTSSRRRTFLIFYIQTHFWSMGEGKGTPSFVRTLNSLAERGHAVHVFMPTEIGEDTPYVDTFGDVVLHHEPSPGRIEPRASLPVVKRVVERAVAWQRYQRWARAAGLRIARELNPDLVISLGTSEAPSPRRRGSDRGSNVVRLYGSWLPIEKSVGTTSTSPRSASPNAGASPTDHGRRKHGRPDRAPGRCTGRPRLLPAERKRLERFHPDGPGR